MVLSTIYYQWSGKLTEINNDHNVIDEPLTNEQMVQIIQHGDKSLLGSLYSRNLPYIKLIVKRFSDQNDFDDLCQEAYFGLVQAIEHWNPESDVPFMSYAKYWIIRQLSQYKSQNQYFVRLPSHIFEKLIRYTKTVKVFQQKHGREPSPKEVFKLMNLSDVQSKELQKVIYHINHSVSMDSPIPDSENDDPLSDFITDPNGNDIDDLLDEIERKELETMLWNIVDDLHDQETEVLRMRYQNGMTLKKCASEMNVTPERIRQIENSGLRRIRTKHMDSLRPFVHDVVFQEAYHSGGLSSYVTHNYKSCVERSVEKIERYKHMIMRKRDS